MMGRPTKYNDKVQQIAEDYVHNFKEYHDKVPSIDGLAYALGVSKKTLYNWAENENNKDFLHTLEYLKTNQSRVLINKGLSKEFPANLVAFMMSNHDEYSSKQELVISDNRIKHPDVIHLVAEPLPEGITDAQLCD